MGTPEEPAVPTYEFQCDKCHKRFSVVRAISAPARAHACPRCESKSTRQILSPFYAKTIKKS